MAHYRLYFLDSRDHIRHGVDLDCPDDEAAKAQARARHDGRAVELWRGSERVLRIQAGEPTDPPG